MMPATHLLLTLASGLALGAALAFTALTARVDWRVERSRGPDATARACRLLPVHAPCLATLARQKEEFGFTAAGDWLRLRELEPRDGRLALAAAFSQEAAGDLEQAEQLMRRAAALDRGWLPRWTLASYYYRRQNWPEFWRWTADAASVAPEDPAALFRLCLSAAGDAASAAVPCLGASAPRRLPAFIEFVAREQPAADLTELARRLSPPRAPGDAPLVRPKLLRAAESFLQAGQAGSAHILWRRMGQLGLLPYPPWTGDAPLNNGALAAPVDPPVFDWRIYRLEGLETLGGAPAGSLKFTFSGRQAESIPLLEQWIWAPAGRRFDLSCEFRERALEPGPAGLHWRWLDGTGQVVAASRPPASGEEWAAWRFPLPEVRRPGLHKLVLWAGRPSGLTRLRGEAWVRAIAMTPRAEDAP